MDLRIQAFAVVYEITKDIFICNFIVIIFRGFYFFILIIFHFFESKFFLHFI